MSQVINIDRLLELAAIDLSTEPCRFSDLKESRDEFMRMALTTDMDDIARDQIVRRLRYLELASKVFNVQGYLPESSISPFLERQKCAVFPQNDSPFLKKVSEISTWIIGRFSLEDCVAEMRHGPGVVSEGLMSYDKWLACMPATELSDMLDPLRRLPRLAVPCRCSKYYDVPKTAWKRRGICAEPASLQFVQQGIGRFIARRLRPFTDLRDQSRNREAASNFAWNTIDLSGASDSISIAHADFIGPIELELAVLDYRSEWCYVPRVGMIELDSLASMGNGFCFPYLTLAVVSIIAATCTEVFGINPRDRKAVINAFRSHAAVYGDDIVLSSDIDFRVRAALEQFGFRINSQKSSLSEGRLRESCGAFVVDGVEVRNIVRLRDISGETLESLVHLCHVQRAAFMGGLTNVAEWMSGKLGQLAQQHGIKLARLSWNAQRYPGTYGDLSGSMCVFAHPGRSNDPPLSIHRRHQFGYISLPALCKKSRKVDLAWPVGAAVCLWSDGVKVASPESYGATYLRNRPFRFQAL